MLISIGCQRIRVFQLFVGPSEGNPMRKRGRFSVKVPRLRIGFPNTEIEKGDKRFTYTSLNTVSDLHDSGSADSHRACRGPQMSRLQRLPGSLHPD